MRGPITRLKAREANRNAAIQEVFAKYDLADEEQSFACMREVHELEASWRRKQHPLKRLGIWLITLILLLAGVAVFLGVWIGSHGCAIVGCS